MTGTIWRLSPTEHPGPAYVCMAAVDWWHDSHAHSEIQLMRRVARTRRVLFVNSIGLRLPMPGRTSQPLQRILRKARNTLRFLSRPVPDLPDFHVLSPLVLPLYGSRTGRALNGALVRTQLKLVGLALGLGRPVFVITMPTAWEVVRPVHRRALIVNKADKFSSLPDVDQTYIAGLERDLLVHADRVLYVSRELMAEDAPSVDGRAVFLDHGVDVEHFTRRPAEEVPADLARLRRPRLGYFGVIDEYKLDLDLIARLAREIPEADVVLVGQVSCALDRFDGLDNVHCLGARPYEEMPAYGSGFDVALMPYQRNEWVQNINPIKLKEYLALGLAVVATDVPEVRRYADWVSIADDADDFVARVREAVATGGPSDPEGRRAAVADASWDSRAAELVALSEQGV